MELLQGLGFYVEKWNKTGKQPWLWIVWWKSEILVGGFIKEMAVLI